MQPNSTKNLLGLILVVDDTAAARKGTALLVSSLNYAVDEANSGQDALNKLNARQYSAIVMDLQMPEMSGFECAKRIRAAELGSGSRVPIIAFTSSSEIGIQESCIASGMDACLSKGCPSDQLSETLKQFALKFVDAKPDLETRTEFVAEEEKPSLEALMQDLLSGLLANQEVSKALDSCCIDDMAPLEIAKILVTLAGQLTAAGNSALRDELKAAAAKIIDHVVDDGVEGLSQLT